MHKIAPDLSEEELIQVADSLVRHNIDGVIATNTTLDRSLVQGMKNCDQTGGLALLAQAMEHDTRGGIRMDSRYVSWERLDHFDGVLILPKSPRTPSLNVWTRTSTPSKWFRRSQLT